MQPRTVDRKDDYYERLAEFISRKQKKKTKKERPANEKFIQIDTFKDLQENYKTKKEEKLNLVENNINNLRRI